MTIRGRERVADWIEIALAVRGAHAIGLDALHGFFERHNQLEAQQVNTGIREMERRARVLGDRYPFRLHGEYAVQALAETPASVYLAMTLMSPGNPAREYLTSSPDAVATTLFENIVVSATASLWGDEGRALRFGWPSDVGRPPEFNQAIQWLAKQIGVSVGQGYRQPRRKDGGVDVISWRPFPDHRGGFPILLVQCTLQENLVVKGLDIDARLWSSWLALDVDPMVALASPMAIPKGVIWDELALKYLILDRLRLAELVKPEALEGEGQRWVSATIDLIREHMAEIGEL